MCFKPSGEPHAVYQGSYLVPISVGQYEKTTYESKKGAKIQLLKKYTKVDFYVLFHQVPGPGAVETIHYFNCIPFQAEALAVPTSARLDRISEFLRFGPVTFDTLVLHTGSGDIVPLSTYFNR